MKNKLSKISVGFFCITSILCGGYMEYKSLINLHDMKNKKDVLNKIDITDNIDIADKMKVIENKSSNINLEKNYSKINKIFNMVKTTKNITMKTGDIGYNIIKDGVYVAPKIAYTGYQVAKVTPSVVRVGYQVAKITAKTGYAVAKVTPTVVRVGYKVTPVAFKILTKIH